MSAGVCSNTGRLKIGLALSGGGFRASIFHLGVIRRLEELGIMKDVAVVSTVSGGSIIGAYYVCEMERRLRCRRDDLDDSEIDSVRLTIFQEIAADFLNKIQRNLRTRALVFSPFFHPIMFLKSLWPTVSRSDLMQAEFDRVFFGGTPLTYGRTMGDLPSVTREQLTGAPANAPASNFLAGPRMVINTTSLLTGERVCFSRESISGVNELKKVDSNNLTLARVVGASACVPGLFPPTFIAGNMLVDGGVSDNQGLDGLLYEGRTEDGSGEFSKADYNLLIVSDASGQLEQLNSLSNRFAAVMPRTSSILQHEIRNKMMTRLRLWKEAAEAKWEINRPEHEQMKCQAGSTHIREFAFVHLFLNLKERQVKERLPSEYIPAVGRLRTDLDQFSAIECESLMYHGYTAIDSQLRTHCGKFLDARGKPQERQPLACRPLFNCEDKAREEIQVHLQAGAQPMFLLRSLLCYPWRGAALVTALWLPPIILFLLYAHEPVRDFLHGVVNDFGARLIPGWLAEGVTWIVGRDLIGSFALALARASALLLELFLGSYLLALLTYLLMRHCVRKWDGALFRKLAEAEFTTHWTASPTPGRSRTLPAMPT